jgi:hypothetical protein
MKIGEQARVIQRTTKMQRTLQKGARSSSTSLMQKALGEITAHDCFKGIARRVSDAHCAAQMGDGRSVVASIGIGGAQGRANARLADTIVEGSHRNVECCVERRECISSAAQLLQSDANVGVCVAAHGASFASVSGGIDSVTERKTALKGEQSAGSMENGDGSLLPMLTLLSKMMLLLVWMLMLILTAKLMLLLLLLLRWRRRWVCVWRWTGGIGEVEMGAAERHPSALSFNGIGSAVGSVDGGTRTRTSVDGSADSEQALSEIAMDIGGISGGRIESEMQLQGGCV